MNEYQEVPLTTQERFEYADKKLDLKSTWDYYEVTTEEETRIWMDSLNIPLYRSQLS